MELINLSPEFLLFEYQDKPWFKPDNPPRSVFPMLNFSIKDLVYPLRSRIAIEINFIRLDLGSDYPLDLLEEAWKLDADMLLLSNCLTMNEKREVEFSDIFKYYMDKVAERMEKMVEKIG